MIRKKIEKNSAEYTEQIKVIKKRTSKFIQEFEKFALKGNVIDLTVGVIIGGLTKDLVKILVDDIIMPPISLLTGSLDFTQKFIVLRGEKGLTLEEAEKAGAVILKYGEFITFLLNFFITAFVIFLLIKGINTLRERRDKQEKKEKKTKKCPYCLSTIPIKATKCAYCTADLPAGDTK